MNAKAKGTRNEHRSMALLEAAGYATTRAAASLGVWDIIGIGPTDVVLCQVKTRDWPGAMEMELLRTFRCPPNAKKLIHRWRDRARLPDVRSCNGERDKTRVVPGRASARDASIFQHSRPGEPLAMLTCFGVQPNPRRESGRLRRARPEGTQAGAARNRIEDREHASSGHAMTFRVKKRGSTYRLEGRYGERSKRDSGERERLRLSLGTSSGDAAQTLLTKIDKALAGGPDSLLWNELRGVLPPETFDRLAVIVGHTLKQAAPRHTWQDLAAKFDAWMSQQVVLGRMRTSTKARYAQTVKSFGDFLTTRGITELAQINRALVEDFKAWRLQRVLARKFSRGGRGVVLDTAILHRIFAYAISECELIERNPVRLDGRPGDNPERGARPFKAVELGNSAMPPAPICSTSSCCGGRE